jgi:integration host factor subunit alpha
MGAKTLTRADLAEAVVRKVGLPRNESQELVELVLNEISGSLSRGEAVKLSSFGSFGIRSKGERIGRNPKTGKEVPITPRRKQHHEGPNQRRPFGGHEGLKRRGAFPPLRSVGLAKFLIDRRISTHRQGLAMGFASTSFLV